MLLLKSVDDGEQTEHHQHVALRRGSAVAVSYVRNQFEVVQSQHHTDR